MVRVMVIVRVMVMVMVCPGLSWRRRWWGGRAELVQVYSQPQAQCWLTLRPGHITSQLGSSPDTAKDRPGPHGDPNSILRRDSQVWWNIEKWKQRKRNCKTQTWECWLCVMFDTAGTEISRYHLSVWSKNSRAATALFCQWGQQLVLLFYYSNLRCEARGVRVRSDFSPSNPQILQIKKFVYGCTARV